MRVRSGSDEKRQSVCRVNKNQLNMITAKRLYYYIDQKIDDDGEKKFYYVLVDNTKGNMKISEFESMQDLEKAVK